MTARAAIVLVGLAACSPPPGEPAPRRACELRLWQKPSAPVSRLEVVGSWDGWTTPRALDLRPDGWWLARLPLEPGAYPYLLRADGRQQLDAERDTTAFHDGAEVSWAEVEDCRASALQVESAAADGSKAQLELVYWQPEDGAGLVASSLAARFDDGQAAAFELTGWDPGTGRLAARVSQLAKGKHRLHLADGLLALDAQPFSLRVFVKTPNSPPSSR